MIIKKPKKNSLIPRASVVHPRAVISADRIVEYQRSVLLSFFLRRSENQWLKSKVTKAVIDTSRRTFVRNKKQCTSFSLSSLRGGRTLQKIQKKKHQQTEVRMKIA